MNFNPSAIGAPYAKALLALAEGQTAAIAEEAGALLELLVQSADLRTILTSPAISKAERDAFIRRVFGGKVSDLILRFLLVLNAKGRAPDMGTILATCVKAFAHAHGEVDVTATLPAAADAAMTEALKTQITAALKKKVHLSVKADPSILGGLTLRIGDALIDASVATKLAKLKGRLDEAGREYARRSLASA